MVEVALRPKTPFGHASVWQRETDWPIMIAAFVLLGVGLMLSLAAGPPAAERMGYSDSFTSSNATSSSSPPPPSP